MNTLKTLTTLTTLTALITLWTGCVPEPTSPLSTHHSPLIEGGVYVLCEGLWSQDNSTLAYLSPTGNVVRDVVSVYNAGTKLGDTSTDIVRRSDTLYVAVSNSRSICMVRMSDGTWLGRTPIPNGKEPYRLALSGSGKLFCTNINDDSITELDAGTMEVVVPRASVGPAPEGIACIDGKVYIANSGFGDLRKSEDGSGTVSVLSEYDLSTVATIRGLPNVGYVQSDPIRHRVWLAYRHYASEPDSLGGVVVIDSKRDTIVAHWRMALPMGIAVDAATGATYVLCSQGVERFVVEESTPTRIISHNSTSGNDMWYGIGFDAQHHMILIANARSYVTDGEVLFVDISGTIQQRFNVGLNPNAFAF